MEKLIELLRERKPNFDENHILDMMYSEGIIFIKDGKPVYTYDKIFPNTERMIINGKLGFIKWLVENDKIDKKKFEDEFFVCGCCGYKLLSTRETCDACGDEVLNIYEALLMRLAISSSPIDDLISYLK